MHRRPHSVCVLVAHAVALAAVAGCDVDSEGLDHAVDDTDLLDEKAEAYIPPPGTSPWLDGGIHAGDGDEWATPVGGCTSHAQCTPTGRICERWGSAPGVCRVMCWSSADCGGPCYPSSMPWSPGVCHL